jgi:formylglycine-generating enzyme required for sulfatase activity
MPHIFISYAKKDSRPLAEKLFETISGMEGFSAWMDSSLDAAESWALQIQEQIDEADLVLVLLSPDVNRKPSATQRRSFVLNEIDYTQQEGKPILPIMAQQAKMPVQIAGLEYIDFTQDRKAAIERLIETLREIYPAPPPPPMVEASPVSAPIVESGPPNWLLFGSFGFLSLIVIATLIFLPSYLNSRDPRVDVQNTASPTSLVINLNQTRAASPSLSPDNTASDTPLMTDEPSNTPTDAPSATNTDSPTETATDAPTASPDPMQDALARAQNFSGTSNSDWLVYTQTFADNIEMALVPPACFQMGSNPEQAQYALNALSADPEWLLREQNADRYCIPQAFWIDVKEVSQSDFARLGGRQSIPSNNVGMDFPVETLTWFEANDYCESLGKRLPTEAEWEYVARGVQSLAFPWGNEFSGSRVNYCDTNCSLEFRDATINDGYSRTAPVGSYPSGVSWVGALDMSGNVWEWTSSLYQDYPYNPDDGREVNTGGDVRRVIRGGSWDDYASLLRSSARSWNDSTDRYNYIGFRCARDIEN